MIRTLLVAGILVYCAFKQSKQVPWPLVVAGAATAFLFMYPFRSVLVGHLKIMTWVLSASMVAALAATFAVIETNADFYGTSIILAAFLGAYLGCYFWLMSDPRIERTDG